MEDGRLREAVAHGGSTECQTIDRTFYEVNVKIMLCIPQMYFNLIAFPKIKCNYTKIFECTFSARNSIFFFLQYLLLPLSGT